MLSLRKGDKKCTICGILISRRNKEFCSRKCSMRGIWLSEGHREKMVFIRKGRKITWRDKISEAKKAEKNYNWKGEKANYFSKHNWLRKWHGNPIRCEHCKKEGEHYNQIRKGKITKTWNLHWANLSGKYIRRIEDWIGLCPSCHGKYDSQKRKEAKQKLLCAHRLS